MEIDSTSFLLGVISPIVAYFFGCIAGFVFRVWRDGQVKRKWKKSKSLPRITDQPAKCVKCGWIGTVWDCEGDVDRNGNLGCPECLEIIEVIV
jgi:hypothetical protein